MGPSELMGAAGALLTGVGFCCTAHQLRLSRKIACGEFLLRLEELFTQHDEVHVYLMSGEWPDHKPGPSTMKEWIAVNRYMGLFERIQVVIDDGILDLDTFDKLYGYRIFYIVQNTVIFQEKLVNRKAQWQLFIRLWRDLEKRDRDRQILPYNQRALNNGPLDVNQ